MRDVANAVMAANSRAAEPDLRAAMLRSQARSMNWLSQLGPQVSVTSLGAVMASVFIEQVLFDNGAKRAERDYARANVEVAAVALAQDSNDRVLQALELYLTVQAAQARAQVKGAGTERMQPYVYIMTERVNAGISNRADLQVVEQKQNQMLSDLAADTEAAAAAMSELQAMAEGPLGDLSGISGLAAPAPNAVALTVLIASAGFLPGLSVGGTINGDGTNKRMAVTGGEEITPEVIAGALSATGLTTRILRPATLTPDLWPALCELTSGQVVLVIEQRRDALFVYDTTCPGSRAEVQLLEFMSVFAGLVVRASVTAEELTRRHADKGRAKHWFWGEMLAFRRNLFEVAMGSFVANLLAVAVALFSLQVYDRVIPHQSVATLWVLALGAGFAMLLEAFLRIARARLMDGAGRRIELAVQGLLMDRILGMRSGIKGQSPSSVFSAVHEFGSVREFFTASTIGTLTDLPFIVLFLALVASIGGNVVWVLFLGGALMVLPSFFLQKKMIALTQQPRGASIKSSRLLHEVIYESDTIKSQRGEDRFRRLWGELTALSSLATSEQRASVLVFLLCDKFAWIDDIVRADGAVVSASPPQIIQNLEGGILAELPVAEGDIVEPGQVLARLRDTQFQTTADDLLISADTFPDERRADLPPHYMVTLQVDLTNLTDRQSQIEIRSGMMASVELYTGAKTVLQYLTRPLYRGQEAFREC